MDRSVCDFGVVADTARVLEHTFLLTNTSRDSCFILQVERSCGCTQTHLSADALAPGETARLDVQLTVDAIFNHVDKPVTVFVGGQREPLILRMVADHPRAFRDPAGFRYAPGGPARFTANTLFAGYVQQGELGQVSINVYNDSDKPLVLRQANRLPRRLRVQLPEQVEPYGIGRITAFFDMRRARRVYGECQHELLLKDGEGKAYSLLLYGLITDPFRQMASKKAQLSLPYRSRQILPEDQAAGKMEASFRVRNTGEDPLRVRKLELLTPASGVQVRISARTIAPGGEALLTFTLRGKALESGAQCGLTVNDPIQPYAVLSVVPEPL